MTDGHQSASSRASLEINDDPQFQRGFWIAERVSWLFFALLLVLAVLGFTGMGGVFAVASVRTETAEIEFPRVTRWEASDEVRISLSPSDSTQTVIVVPTSLLAIFSVENVWPWPMRFATASDGIHLLLERQPGERAEILVHVRARQPSMAASHTIKIDGERFEISPLVLP